MHHTKVKADIAVGKVISDLLEKEFVPCIPLSEHQPYTIYCPDKNIVLYVPNSIKCPKAIRFDKPSNNQVRFIKWANSYLKIRKESSETIRHTPVMVKT